MFVGEEANVIERIAIFWLENESEPDEKTEASVKSILEKELLDPGEQEIEAIEKIANFWLKNAREPEKETSAFVKKILMKIEFWRLDKGREYYERYKFLAMFQDDERKVLLEALRGFIAAKRQELRETDSGKARNDLNVAESLYKRLEEH